ncbi:P-loop NTPase fold protein [Bradyrhizobium sp. DASA03007]|uniref:P-loop NTPase fold protein n=1 Tax=unclassified Bradyrhizobium TaxID=2631580 RepID=UPI003F726573
MTSTEAVKREIERFLRSPEPEVLCITGAWGVGKTYTWRTILDRVQSKRETGLSRYSYVSLFGIDSLEGMKTAIFENLEFLLPEGSTSLERILSGGNAALKGGKKLAGALSASPVPYLGGALSKAQPLLFSAIRNQIVCVDDLERRGSISVKDVFGLISYLREQRACKAVFLLNRGQLDDAGQKQFDDYFEKVIDTNLVLAPTSEEALAIAITGNDDLSNLIREHCKKLNISNIRVIKKIERLIRMLDGQILSQCAPDTVRQIVHSMVMFGWRKLDTGAAPPPITYLKRGEFERYMMGRDEIQDEENVGDGAEREGWDVILDGYGWGSMDDLDTALLNFVETSLMDADQIISKAKEIEAGLGHRKQMEAFEQCWRPFHDSFNDNVDEVCASIVQGIKNNFAVVSRPNLDAAISILNDIGRASDATDLLDFALANGSTEFWTSDDPFHREVKDARILQIIQERRQSAQPALNFEKDLGSVQSLNREKMALLAAVPVERFEQLFKDSSGEALRGCICAPLELRKIGGISDDAKRVAAKVEEALRRIAKTSKLNAIRMKKYDVPLDANEED